MQLPQPENGLLKWMVQMQKEHPNPRIKTIVLTSQNSKGNVSKGALCVIYLKKVFQPTRTEYQNYLVYSLPGGLLVLPGEGQRSPSPSCPEIPRTLWLLTALTCLLVTAHQP